MHKVTKLSKLIEQGFTGVAVNCTCAYDEYANALGCDCEECLNFWEFRIHHFVNGREIESHYALYLPDPEDDKLGKVNERLCDEDRDLIDLWFKAEKDVAKAIDCNLPQPANEGYYCDYYKCWVPYYDPDCTIIAEYGTGYPFGKSWFDRWVPLTEEKHQCPAGYNTFFVVHR